MHSLDLGPHTKVKTAFPAALVAVTMIGSFPFSAYPGKHIIREARVVGKAKKAADGPQGIGKLTEPTVWTPQLPQGAASYQQCSSIKFRARTCRSTENVAWSHTQFFQETTYSILRLLACSAAHAMKAMAHMKLQQQCKNTCNFHGALWGGVSLSQTVTDIQIM